MQMDRLFHFLGDMSENPLILLFMICAFSLVVFLLKNLFRYLALYFLSDVKKGVVRDLRLKLFSAMLEMPQERLEKYKKGHFLSVSSNDLMEIEYGIMFFMESMIKEPLLILITIISLFLISPGLTLIVLLILPFSVGIIALATRKLKNVSFKAQENLSEITSFTEDSLSGMKTLKAFNAEEKFKSKYNTLNQSQYHLSLKALRKRDLASPLSEFLGLGIVVLILFTGGYWVLVKKSLAPELLITYILILSQVISPAKAFTNAFAFIKKASASLLQIQEFLDFPKQEEYHTDITDFENKIEFKEVSFSRNENTILERVNLEFPKNKWISIIGESGSGKSSIINLLLKFYSSDSGEIKIDGKNLKDLNTKSLRNLFSYVSQDINLFNLTLEENITLLNELEDRVKLKNLFQRLGLEKLLDNRDDLKISSENQEHKLSGGEKQRIAIARALYKDAPILIFDEATAAIDIENEQLLLELLEELRNEKTIIYITHKVKTIQNADYIYLMDKGRVTEQGSHLELIRHKGKYFFLNQYTGSKN